MIQVAVGALEIGPNRVVVVRHKDGLVGIEAGGETSQINSNLQHAREATQADQRMRAPLPMAVPGLSPSLHPEFPIGKVPVHGAFSVRGEVRRLTGEPVGVQLGFALGGSRRAVGLFNGRGPHGFPAQTFLMFELVPIHDREVKVMRGETGQAAMGADGAPECSEAQRQVIRRPPALAEAGPVGGGKGLVPGATDGFTETGHGRAGGDSGCRLQVAGEDAGAPFGFTVSLPFLNREVNTHR